MPNDMSGAFIAFDEASKLDWKALTVLPMPSDHKADIFYFPKTGKLGKLSKKKEIKEYTFTNVTLDLDKVAPGSMDPQVIYDTMRHMMKRQQEIMFHCHRHEEHRHPTQKAYEILKTPDHWVQRSVREFRGGHIAFCILGALMAKWGLTEVESMCSGFREDCRKVADLIVRRYPGSGGREIKSVIAHWNDDPRRQFSEVQEILRLADV